MKISTPGRICLFGEHQDYLGLPVIAAAISRRINVSGEKRTDNTIHIHMPDIQSEEIFLLEPDLRYTRERDYFKSAINVLRRHGYGFESGFEVHVNGNIPINSGTSSSSALLVTWIHFLTRMADVKPVEEATRFDIGKYAVEAEVLEFGEPGGMMDQYSTALGNIMYLETVPEPMALSYPVKLGTFVLGDSLEPKDTLGILKHVKFGMLDIIQQLSESDAAFDLHTYPAEEAGRFRSQLSEEQFRLLEGNLSDRDILREARAMFAAGSIDQKRVGELLNLHQNSLRDAKKVSTPKINRMVEASLKAGALGAKINGSGGGGCMFAYAPNDPEAVAEAIEREGGKPYIIEVDEGTRVE
ncbi:MAG: GHMP kinase [Leadbetterella sp.]|nr:GHMP kinase [Leadbetterella sp.]